MKYKLKRYQPNNSYSSIFEEIEVPDFTMFYKFNSFTVNNVSYATYSCILKYDEEVYLTFYRMINVFVYYLAPLDKMIVVFKNYRFIHDSEPYTTLNPFYVEPLYLECFRNQGGVRDTKEVYKLLRYTGFGFDVIKLTFKDPLLDQEHPSISREMIDLATLFRDQEELTIDEVDEIRTTFIDETSYEYFLDFINSLIHHGETKSNDDSSQRDEENIE